MPSTSPEHTGRAQGEPSSLMALSIRQPYAEAIIRGEKVEEYRSWSTNHRGPLVIHAASTKPRPADLAQYPRVDPGELVYGALVGVVDVVDVLFDNHEECYVWILEKPRKLAEPLVCKGKLNLWQVPRDLAERMAGQV